MIRYTIQPGTPRTKYLPVARFEVDEEGFNEPTIYEVVATPEGLDFRAGHKTLKRALPQWIADKALSDAQMVLEETDKQPF